MNIEKNLKSQNNVLRHLFRWISTFCALERISRFQFDLLQNTKWRPYKRNFRERTDRITVSSKIFLLNIKQMNFRQKIDSKPELTRKHGY